MEGKEVLEAIFLHALEGILVSNKNGEIISINPSAEKMLGYEKGKLIGQKIEVLIPNCIEKIHVTHREGFNKNAQPREMGRGKNLFAKRKDGSEFPVEISLSPYTQNNESFVIAFIIDITLRKKEEKNQELFSAIVNSSSDAIITKTLDGKITSWNPGAEKIFGYNAEEAIGKDILILVPDHLYIEEEVIKDKIHKGEKIRHYKTQRIRKNGALIYVSLTISPLTDVYGKIVGASKILRNITEQVAVEEKLAASEEKIRTALDNMMEGIQILDYNWRYTYVNDALVRYSDYTREELMGFTIMEKYPGIEQTDLFKVMSRCMNDRTVEHLENEFTFPNGTKRYFDLSIQPVPEGIFILSINISDRKKAEAEQKKSEIYYQSLIEQASDVIYIVDSSDRPKFIDINQTGCDLLGYTKDEILKLTTFDIIFEDEFVDSALRIKELRGGKSLRNERRLKRKDGSAVEVEFSAKKMEDGNFLVVARDISERKKAEEKIAASEKRFRVLVENSKDVISLLDAKFNTIYRSPSAARILGWTDEELNVAGTIKNIHIDDVEHIKNCMTELIANPEKAVKIVFRNLHKDGHYVWLEGVAVNMLDNINVNAIVFNFRDFTEQKNSEIKILELNESLENRVKERTHELESFSYSVSHDLRAPLRAVNGFAQVLSEDYGSKLDEEGNRIIQRIRYNASKMGALIDDLLAFSRLGRKEVQKTEIDTVELVERVLAEINKLIKHTAKIEIGKLHKVKADYGLLSQALFNLISNAIKYSSKKEYPLVEIFTEEKNGEIIFTVKDNGAGFDMAYADKLFGVFQRLHSQEEFEGTGVGLAIVQRIIFKQGGRVWAEGKINEGAIFHFTLTNN